MPTQQGTDSFDHGFDVPADYDAVFGSPTSAGSPLYQGRNASLRIDAASGAATHGVRKNITGSPGLGWMGFPLRISATPAGAVTLAALHSVTSDKQARIQVNASRVLGAYIAGGSLQTGATISVDTWYWIEMIYDATAATHSLYWRVAGSDQTTATVSATGSDTCDFSQLFSLFDDASLTWYSGGYWSWGSASTSSDWLGEPSEPVADEVLRVVRSGLRW